MQTCPQNAPKVTSWRSKFVKLPPSVPQSSCLRHSNSAPAAPVISVPLPLILQFDHWSCLLLFYINDIAQHLHSTVHLFVDHTVSNKRDAGKTSTLFPSGQIFGGWMMEFHPQKCEVSVSSSSSSKVHPSSDRVSRTEVDIYGHVTQCWRRALISALKDCIE